MRSYRRRAACSARTCSRLTLFPRCGQYQGRREDSPIRRAEQSRRRPGTAWRHGMRPPVCGCFATGLSPHQQPGRVAFLLLRGVPRPVPRPTGSPVGQGGPRGFRKSTRAPDRAGWWHRVSIDEPTRDRTARSDRVVHQPDLRARRSRHGSFRPRRSGHQEECSARAIVTPRETVLTLSVTADGPDSGISNAFTRGVNANVRTGCAAPATAQPAHTLTQPDDGDAN